MYGSLSKTRWARHTLDSSWCMLPPATLWLADRLPLHMLPSAACHARAYKQVYCRSGEGGSWAEECRVSGWAEGRGRGQAGWWEQPTPRGYSSAPRRHKQRERTTEVPPCFRRKFACRGEPHGGVYSARYSVRVVEQQGKGTAGKSWLGWQAGGAQCMSLRAAALNMAFFIS